MKKRRLFFVAMVFLAIVAFFIFIHDENEVQNEPFDSEVNNLPDEEVQMEIDNSEPESSSQNEKKSEQLNLIEWKPIEGKWEPSGSPSECPNLIFYSPVDLKKATSVLYPGQYRGGEYKAHGGFRFDKETTNEIEVRAPFDGYVWRGARYFASGEIQYTVEIVNECGIIHRLGHLLELSPEFNSLAQHLPEPKELDSRLYPFEKFINVKRGDLIATKVGVQKNVFMDWGAYDVRKENEASKNAAYQEKFENMKDSAFYAVCWIDNLPADQQGIVKSLPAADSVSGKQSDYCKE